MYFWPAVSAELRAFIFPSRPADSSKPRLTGAQNLIFSQMDFFNPFVM